MATHAPITGALTRATSNVVRLPTAARRKPENHRYAAQRAAKAALRAAEPWPGEYRHHHARRADELAATLAAVPNTPELELLTAMLAAMPEEVRVATLPRLLARSIVGNEAARQALAVLKTARMTIGERVDLDAAFARRREGR